VYFGPILMKLEFSRNIQMSNFMDIRPVRVKLFHADGQPRRSYNPFSQCCERA